MGTTNYSKKYVRGAGFQRVFLPAVLLGLLLGLVSCAVPPRSQPTRVEPEAAPARLAVAVRQKVTPAQVQAAILRSLSAGGGMPGKDDIFDEPVWRLRLRLVRPEGSPAKPVLLSGPAEGPVIGYQIEGAAVYRIPAGAHDYRVSLTCTVGHSRNQGRGRVFLPPVVVQDLVRDETLAPAPGEALRLEPFGPVR